MRNPKWVLRFPVNNHPNSISTKDDKPKQITQFPWFNIYGSNIAGKVHAFGFEEVSSPDTGMKGLSKRGSQRGCHKGPCKQEAIIKSDRLKGCQWCHIEASQIAVLKNGWYPSGLPLPLQMAMAVATSFCRPPPSRAQFDLDQAAP